MPPKKRKSTLVWMPLSYKALVGPATGEFREYYLPLSEEEIQQDLHQLSLLLQQYGLNSKRGRRPAVVLQPHADATSDEHSPSSQQGEDENDSGNPGDQQGWAGHKAVAAQGAAGGGGAPHHAPAQQLQQQPALA